MLAFKSHIVSLSYQMFSASSQKVSLKKNQITLHGIFALGILFSSKSIKKKEVKQFFK